jgi:ribosomal protein S18 acetylase RimI-like enzyme
MNIETIIFKGEKMIKKPSLETKTFDNTEKDKIVKTYAQVFAGAPWYEQFSCVYCGKGYGTPEGTIESVVQKYGTCTNDNCTKPDTDLNIVSTYEGAYYNAEEKRIVKELGKEILSDALQQEYFFGVAAKTAEKYVGFSWGYKLPKERSPSVWFDAVQEKLTDMGVDTEKVFYAAEIGVLNEYRRNGIATTLTSERMNYAKNNGFEKVVLRTVNPDLLSTYDKLFGEGNYKVLFRDPNPSKSDEDKWYMWNLKDLEGQR